MISLAEIGMRATLLIARLELRGNSEKKFGAAQLVNGAGLLVVQE